MRVTPDTETVNLADVGPAVTEVGGLWHLRSSPDFLRNALVDASFGVLLGGKKADMVLADPPYCVKSTGTRPATVRLTSASSPWAAER